MHEREGRTIDFAAMRRMFDDDQELIADVVGLFLDDHPVQLGALQAAADAGDRQRIRREAHTIKGCTSNFCAADVVQAARTLEEMSEDEGVDAAAIRRGVEVLAQRLDRMAGELRAWQAGALGAQVGTR